MELPAAMLGTEGACPGCGVVVTVEEDVHPKVQTLDEIAASISTPTAPTQLSDLQITARPLSYESGSFDSMTLTLVLLYKIIGAMTCYGICAAMTTFNRSYPLSGWLFLFAGLAIAIRSLAVTKDKRVRIACLGAGLFLVTMEIYGFVFGSGGPFSHLYGFGVLIFQLMVIVLGILALVGNPFRHRLKMMLFGGLCLPAISLWFFMGGGMEMVYMPFVGGSMQGYGSAVPAIITMIACLIILMICIVWSQIINLMLIYRYWNLIQDAGPRTTPAKAIGFLFIPFFNLYWIYVVIVVLTKETNDYCELRKINAEHVNERLAFRFFLCCLLIYMPFLIPLALPLMMVFNCQWHRQMATMAASLVNAKQSPQLAAP